MDTERVPLYFTPLDDNPRFHCDSSTVQTSLYSCPCPAGFSHKHPLTTVPVPCERQPPGLGASFAWKPFRLIHPNTQPTPDIHAFRHSSSPIIPPEPPPWFYLAIQIQRPTVRSSHKQQSLRHRIVSVVFIQPPHGHRFPQQPLRITLQYLAPPSRSGSHFAYYLASSLLYQIILVVYLKCAPKRKPGSSPEK